MQKDFDKWNKKKKIVNATSLKYSFFYHEREIWWSAIGLNVGVEIDGKNNIFERPVLIIKKFNKEMFWGVPLTTSKKDGAFFHELNHQDGLSWAIISQLKLFSSQRLLRKMGTVSVEQVSAIKRKIRDQLSD
jgi:mRNA interferase MazF